MRHHLTFENSDDEYEEVKTVPDIVPAPAAEMPSEPQSGDKLALDSNVSDMDVSTVLFFCSTAQASLTCLVFSLQDGGGRKPCYLHRGRYVIRLLFLYILYIIT